MGGGAGELSHWCDGLDSSKTRCGLGIAQCADEVVLAVPFDHPRDPDLRAAPEFAAIASEISRQLGEAGA